MRPQGSRNAGFDERRASLLARLRARLTDREAPLPTLRALAAAADCSVSTLTHYFGRRSDIVRAVFEQIAIESMPDREAAAASHAPFEQSIRDEVRRATAVLSDRRISATLAMGLTEGMGTADLGPAFLDAILDPFVRAIASKCDVHVARGEMRAVDTRMAALALLSPLLIAALHQRELGGAEMWPLDLEALAEMLGDGFVRAYAA